MAINVNSLGAGNGSDDTTIINNALATGEPVYFPHTNSGYLVTDAIKPTRAGQPMFGDDRCGSFFVVPSTFNMAAQGVIACATGEPGFTWRQMGMRFQQLDSASLASMVHFPPAIYAVNQPRFKIAECAITNAWTGINMTGNSGGASIDDLQISTYSDAIDIDGSLDIVRINRLHAWPFGMTQNQMQAYWQGASGIRSGRCDGLYLESCLLICKNQLTLYGSAAGQTFGSASDCDFDSYGSLNMSAGIFSVSGGGFSGAVDAPLIKLSGGKLRVYGSYLGRGCSGSTALVEIGPNYPNLKMISCDFESAGADVSSINAKAGTIQLSHNFFDRTPNVAYTAPTVVASWPSRMSAEGNRGNDKGIGDGVFFQINTDEWHRIIGNTAPGWRSVFPPAGVGIYLAN